MVSPDYNHHEIVFAHEALGAGKDKVEFREIMRRADV